jgi:hypothetical protein
MLHWLIGGVSALHVLTLCPIANSSSTCHHTSLRLRLLRSSLLFLEVQTHTVDAVSLIRWRWVSLSLEHMSQMTTAIAAHNLYPLHAKCPIAVSRHRTGYGIVERRPSAPTLELLVRGVQRRVASGASVDARRRCMLVVFAGVWRFGALFAEDTKLLCISGVSQMFRCTIVLGGATHQVTAEPAIRYRSSAPDNSSF